jgi:hypothetical protein
LLLQRYLKERRLNFKAVVLLSVMKASFNFVLGGYGYKNINNFSIFTIDFLSIKAS